MKFAVVTPWHNPKQRDQFLKEWSLRSPPDWLFLQQDNEHEGCARTKNKGIVRAMDAGAEIIVVLDDDCYPEEKEMPLSAFVECHIAALQPQEVVRFLPVTDPPSRGTPFYNRTRTFPVAASMGFWSGIPDYGAPGQLCYPEQPPRFNQSVIFGLYFPLCAMNIAFRATEWPWCQQVNVPRVEDTWGGYLWQRKAYADGKCFNLRGPTVRHARQSNVFKNLKVEAETLERNETLWQRISEWPITDYEGMLLLHDLTV